MLRTGRSTLQDLRLAARSGTLRLIAIFLPVTIVAIGLVSARPPPSKARGLLTSTPCSPRTLRPNHRAASWAWSKPVSWSWPAATAWRTSSRARLSRPDP